MPAPDPLAKLKALTQSQSGSSPFAHESEEDALGKLLGIFTRIPTGERLLDESRAHGIEIKLLKTQTAFSFSPDTKTMYLGMSAAQTNPRARMLLHLAMGLTEAIQEYTGLPRPDINMTKEQYRQINLQKQRDILFNMCAVAYELISSLGLREILDELTKMGHIDLYKAYEEDLQSVG